MKSFDELTQLGAIRRFRQLAKEALALYGLNDSRVEFLAMAGNILFRVYELQPNLVKNEDSPFKSGQYLLRIHDSGEQKTNAILLEMEWLRSIRRDTGLPVPEPIQALDGRLLVSVSAPGIPETRDCTILRWLRGRRIKSHIRPHHYRLQGRAMAQLHNHAAKWSRLNNIDKRRFDYDGLFNDDAGAGIPNREAWALLPDSHRQAYEIIARRVRLVTDDWGKNSDIYGLIHGDCGIDANVLFWKGTAQIIDFDGSGYGYYLYDLALALEHCWDEPGYPQYQRALLDGYTEIRTLPAEHLPYIDLFRAAFYVYMGLWTVAMDQAFPDSSNKLNRHRKWLGYGMKFIERYLNRIGGTENSL
ncbi:MAG: phosphotransferase [candidate division Zixibacteria bacterium]|nr:phosphotransferase [candidate division Zixibacteria bacterium]